MPPLNSRRLLPVSGFTQGGFWRRWLDRHVPLMDADLSTLDLLDDGRVAVEQVPLPETAL